MINDMDITQLNIQQLAELSKRIADRISQLSASEPAAASDYLIGNSDAQEIARRSGYSIRNTTIVSACERGGIAGATKISGRYKFSRMAFEKWLEGYNPR